MGFGKYGIDDVYKAGDLVYGLSAYRPHMINSWRKKKLGDKPPIQLASTFIDSYADLVGEGASSPTSKSTPFHTAVKGHGKYKDSFISKDDHNPGGADKWSDTAQMWKRKSKGGIYWATILEDRTVHFCLGGLCDKASMTGIANKNYKFKGTQIDEEKDGEKARLITGSELRWVYRNKDVDKVQKNVQFWRPIAKDPDNYEQCAAPWDWPTTESDKIYQSCGQAWGDYTPSKTYSDGDYLAK